MSNRSRKNDHIRTNSKTELARSINNTIKYTINANVSNPMVKASHCWSVVQEQLQTLLDAAIYKQWFVNTCATVIINDVLIITAKDNFASQWLNTHYIELVDALIQLQDNKLSCFFITKKL